MTLEFSKGQTSKVYKKKQKKLTKPDDPYRNVAQYFIKKSEYWRINSS